MDTTRAVIDHGFDEQYMVICIILTFGLIGIGVLLATIRELKGDKEGSILLAIVGVILTVILFGIIAWIGGVAWT
jgi:vacuolar-type H+-ATPase subunit I/STV1